MSIARRLRSFRERRIEVPVGPDALVLDVGSDPAGRPRRRDPVAHDDIVMPELRRGDGALLEPRRYRID